MSCALPSPAAVSHTLPWIVVEAEKEGETHDFEHDKQEDVVVATEKIEKNLHGVERLTGLLACGRTY